jgi:hypothetical protein
MIPEVVVIVVVVVWDFSLDSVLQNDVAGKLERHQTDTVVDGSGSTTINKK